MVQSKDRMRILIAGATGFIGQALVHHLSAHHHTLIVLGRDINKIRKIFGSQVEGISWKELNLGHIKKVDAIINLTGANISDRRWDSKRQLEILESRVSSTGLLANFCSELAANAPVLLNASAVGIYNPVYSIDDQTKLNDENIAINYRESPNFLAEVARSWEMATWVARDQGVRVVNLRFAVVLGKTGGILKKLLPSFKLFLGAKIGSGQQPFPWVSLVDVMRAIQFILENPAIEGPVNIVSPKLITQAEFANTLAKVLHRPRFLTVPAWIVKRVWGQMGEELLLQGVSVKPTKILAYGFVFENDNLETTLQNMTAIWYEKKPV